MTDDKNDYHEFLIKFGKQAHMDRLINQGEVFLNHVGYFTMLEDDQQRGDLNEGVTSLRPLSGCSLSIKDEDGALTQVAKFTSGTVRERSQNLENANLFCLFYLRVPINQDLKLSEHIPKKNWSGFGDTAVIIYEPNAFLDRLTTAAKGSGFEITKKLIEYKDLSNHHGQLDPFIKDEQYIHQQELRALLWTMPAKTSAESVILDLGDLSDISLMLETSTIQESMLRISDSLPNTSS
ncbi:MAG: hypothetical protein RPS47_05600 [Colwellia sp.]